MKRVIPILKTSFIWLINAAGTRSRMSWTMHTYTYANKCNNNNKSNKNNRSNITSSTHATDLYHGLCHN